MLTQHPLPPFQASDGTRMYVFGGRGTGRNIPSKGESTVQIYDPAADTWYAPPLLNNVRPSFCRIKSIDSHEDALPI